MAAALKRNNEVKRRGISRWRRRTSPGGVVESIGRVFSPALTASLPFLFVRRRLEGVREAVDRGHLLPAALDDAVEE